MEQKQRFINLAQSGRFTVSELCEEFGITRKPVHKWLLRYAGGGMKGLEERSRAPKKVSNRTSEEIERLVVSEKRQHLTWGPKKIQRVLMIKHGVERLPAVSTVGEVLKRHGMVKVRKRRGAVFKVERGALTVPEHSNHVVGVDFKGWFMTGDGKRCDPLTVTDLHSRYLSMAQGLTQATTQWTQAAFRGLFRRKGLPEIIRVDNGAPFASMGPGGLSRLREEKGVSQKFVTGVRTQRPAAACMFKSNPRARVLVRSKASALPGIVAAAPIARSARTLRSHWRADRRVGRLSRRSRPRPPRRRFAPEVWDGTEPIPPAGFSKEAAASVFSAGVEGRGSVKNS